MDKENNVSEAEFGRKVGLSRAGISRIINLNRYPSAEVMLEIFIQTEGEIQPNDLLKDCFKNHDKFQGYTGLNFR